MTRQGRVPEICQIVLMICLVRLTDHRHGARRKVMRVRSLRVILKRLVMCAVICFKSPVQPSSLRATDCRTTGGRVVWSRRCETTLEPAPRKAGGVQHVTNVFTGHAHLA